MPPFLCIILFKSWSLLWLSNASLWIMSKFSNLKWQQSYFCAQGCSFCRTRQNGFYTRCSISWYESNDVGGFTSKVRCLTHIAVSRELSEGVIWVLQFFTGASPRVCMCFLTHWQLISFSGCSKSVSLRSP